MKRLIKTVYITSPEVMALDDDSLVITLEDNEIGRTSLRNLESICYFGYKPVRPALMDACAERGVRLNILHPDGQFIAGIVGPFYKNSLLRRQQYKAAEDPQTSLEIAKNMIMAKAFNTRWLFGLMYRDYESQLDRKAALNKADALQKIVGEALAVKEIEPLREIRKKAAKELYSSFNDLILFQKETFIFKGRSSKPPVDPVNALLTFSYELLEEKCTAALESAGLDSCVGFFNKETPGQASLTLDLMEEFRAALADRFVLMLINKNIIGIETFEETAAGNFVITESGAEVIWENWLEYCTNKTMHPYLEEHMEWGMVPDASAMLLAKFLNGEIDKYPAFLRKKP